MGLTLSAAPSQGEMLEARLAQFSEAGRTPATLAEVELSLPLFERIVRPVLDTVGGFFTRRLQAGSLQQTQEKLNLAGKPWGLSASGFFAVRLMAAVLFTAAGFGLSVLMTLDMP